MVTDNLKDILKLAAEAGATDLTQQTRPSNGSASSQAAACSPSRSRR